MPHSSPYKHTIHTQGTSIELVITYLRKWLRIERTHVGRLLWSYPLDYSLPRLVMPLDTTAADATTEEQQPDAAEPDAAAAAPSTAQASSSDGAGVPEQQQGPPKQVPVWGSADACSWLDLDLRKGGSSSASSSSDEGSDEGGNGKGDGPADADGDSSKPPSAA
jgi:hypothetical protein